MILLTADQLRKLAARLRKLGRHRAPDEQARTLCLGEASRLKHEAQQVEREVTSG